ncbi:MAG: hypothetical protein K2N06_00150 [Oscillospiraceae bacterium]|nr:hypothetical protein [Oscillospiraceae bacterium]
MNNINPLLVAMNNIDDSIITNAEKTNKKPIFLCMGIIAAAVAATLLVGFTNVERFGFYVNGTQMNDYELDATPNIQFPSRKGCEEAGAIVRHYRDNRNFTYFFEDFSPTDIFKMYNVNPLMNDKFTLKPGDVYVHANSLEDGSDPENVVFSYNMIHNTIGVNLYVDCQYSVKGGTASVASIKTGDNQKSKIESVKLNDGNKAVLMEVQNDGYDDVYTSVDVVYDNAIYHLYSFDYLTIEQMKQILTDLSVL